MCVSESWTTLDELQFIRGLYNRRNLGGLRTYLSICRNRRWHGEGMGVCVGEVIFAVEDYVIELTKRGDD